MTIETHITYHGDAEGLRKDLIEHILEMQALVPTRIASMTAGKGLAHANGQRDAYDAVINMLSRLKVLP